LSERVKDVKDVVRDGRRMQPSEILKAIGEIRVAMSANTCRRLTARWGLLCMSISSLL
jgi:hypothetical protein